MKGARSSVLFVSALLIALLGQVASGLADNRLALVIGNSAYKNTAPLDNPVNDATDVAAALSAIGFQVTLKLDADRREMDRSIESLARDAANADAVVFYYAGHGMQYAGRNYLMPVDAGLRDEVSLRYEMTAIDDVRAALDRSNGVKIMVLDSCRNNPLAQQLVRSISAGSREIPNVRGLARPEKSRGMVVVYATQADDVANDGSGRNSPFSAAFLKEVKEPGVEIGTMFRRVGGDVYQATGGQQSPELSISLLQEFYLNQGETDRSAWARVRASADPGALREFLVNYPDSFFAPDARMRLASLEREPPVTGAPSARDPGASGAAAKEEPQAAKEAREHADAQKVASLPPAAQGANGGAPIGDPASIDEIRDRLYELNFDPGPLEGPVSEPMREAIRDFERQNNLTPTGAVTAGLLRRLHELADLKPWGAIVYGKDTAKWGMSWGEVTRKAAVARARATCGDARTCSVELSFFGSACGAFAHSGSNWSIVSRADFQRSRDAALADCRKHGAACRIVASTCADGSARFGASN